MHIVVKADQPQKEQFLAKGVPAAIQVSWLDNQDVVPAADAYFDLCFETEPSAFELIRSAPVFANAVIPTSRQLPANVIRMNAWNSFFERPLLELAATRFKTEAEAVLQALGWKYQWVADEPGMVSARVVAMIINEAYFGLGDEISTKADIDIAMKLGTSYPYGPFEWAEKIGLSSIYKLLNTLCMQDARYAVAPALEKEIRKMEEA